MIHVCGMLLRGLLGAINAVYYACYGIGQPPCVPNPIASSTITTGQLHWRYTPSWSPDSHVPKDSVILSVKLMRVRDTDANFFTISIYLPPRTKFFLTIMRFFFKLWRPHSYPLSWRFLDPPLTLVSYFVFFIGTTCCVYLFSTLKNRKIRTPFQFCDKYNLFILRNKLQLKNIKTYLRVHNTMENTQ